MTCIFILFTKETIRDFIIFFKIFSPKRTLIQSIIALNLRFIQIRKRLNYKIIFLFLYIIASLHFITLKKFILSELLKIIY